MDLSQTTKSQTVQSEVTGELMYVNFEDRDDLMICSYEMAESIGKTEEYFNSRRLDRECAKMIDETIADHYDGQRLDEHVLEPLFRKFCPERIQRVLADSIILEVTPPDQNKNKELWDKRYSRDNKKWAEDNASPDKQERFYPCSHPVVINEVINLFRRETANLEEMQRDLSSSEPSYINFDDKKDFYSGSFDRARENGESNLFRKSYKLNNQCAGEMNKAIEDSWDGMRTNISAIYPVLENYCPERVSRVLADTILCESGDGRISNENREWAKTIRLDWNGERRDDHISVLSVHPDKVNQFTGIYRQALPKFNEREVVWNKRNGIMDNPVNEAKAEEPTDNGFQLTDASMEDRHRFCTDMDAIEAAFQPEVGLIYGPSEKERMQKAFGEFSHKISVICKDEIESTIINDPAEQNNFDKTSEPILEDGVATKIAEDFCPERIGHILSETILYYEKKYEKMNFVSDISGENIAWAKEQPMHVPERYSSAYLANGVSNKYLNEFVNHFRSEVLKEDLSKDQTQDKTDEMEKAAFEQERASPPGR